MEQGRPDWLASACRQGIRCDLLVISGHFDGSMRRIFMNVPVIYGFSSVAPLGPTAATLLGRYLQSSSIAEVGSGRASPKLLGHFATESMIAVSGSSESDPRAAYRHEVCQFIDDRLSPAEKLRFIHGLLRRDMVEVRMFLDRIEGLFASLSESERQAPSFSQELTSRDDAEVQIAEVYPGHRPITDLNELRVVASGITRMIGSGAQVRALDTLARHRLSDRQSLDELARLFRAAESVAVQRAIAAVFIRFDYQVLHKTEIVRVLSQSRLKSPSGDDIIDILIRRLRAP